MVKSHLINTAVALLIFLGFCLVLKNNRQVPTVEIQHGDNSASTPTPAPTPTPTPTPEPKPVVDMSLKANYLKAGSIIKFKQEAIVTNTLPETGKALNDKLVYFVHIDRGELLAHIKPNDELEVISTEIGGAFPSHMAPHGMLFAGRSDCIIKVKTKENKIVYILVVAGEKMSVVAKNGYIQYSNPFSLRGTLHTPTFEELIPVFEIIKL